MCNLSHFHIVKLGSPTHAYTCCNWQQKSAIKALSLYQDMYENKCVCKDILHTGTIVWDLKLSFPKQALLHECLLSY